MHPDVLQRGDFVKMQCQVMQQPCLTHWTWVRLSFSTAEMTHRHSADKRKLLRREVCCQTLLQETAASACAMQLMLLHCAHQWVINRQSPCVAGMLQFLCSMPAATMGNVGHSSVLTGLSHRKSQSMSLELSSLSSHLSSYMATLPITASFPPACPCQRAPACSNR